MTIKASTNQTARQVPRAVFGQIKDIWSRIKNSSRRPQRPTVLMFHSVTQAADHDWGPWHYAVTPSEFEATIEHLVEGNTVVPLGDIVDWVRSGDPIPDDAVAITFDDGYENYATNALPILRRHDAPSVVYLSSSLVGHNQKSPFEFRLAHSLESCLGSTVAIDCLGFEQRIDTTADLVDAYNIVRSESKYSHVEFRDTVLASIGGQKHHPVSMLSASDLRSLAADPLVTCGLHGADHIPFGVLSDDEQREAVEASRAQLSRLLGFSPEHFSFPYGSYNAKSIKILRDSNIVSGVTTRSRPLSPRDWNHPYTIPRIDGAAMSIQD